MNVVTAKAEQMELIPKPRICCIDLTNEVTESLKSSGYNIFEGSLGAVVEVPNKRRDDSQLCSLDFNFPVNFHEFDILILDLTNEIKKEFKPLSTDDRKSRKQTIVSLVCRYPANLFDPRPLSASLLGTRIGEVQNRKFIQIVFASDNYDIDYEFIEISDGYPKSHPIEKYSIYSFNSQIPLSQPRIGKEVSICSIRDDIFNLLKKHSSDLNYEQTFHHPTEWNNEKEQYVPSTKFLPLIKNINEEIVSFIQVLGNHITLVLPNIKDKKEFTSELLKSILPSQYPDVFPFSTQFKWIESPDYYTPNQQALINEKIHLQDEFEKKQLAIDNKISDNNKKYKFLHDLLTETDNKLVSAVYSFLKFLEFKNVTLMDEKSATIKEEDIQVEHENGILVIETKGIGGTSTDSDCSQISKIKHRRCKERNAFDVWALYIVNHQRFLPPLSRRNPPFTENQIEDAKNDERGLVTTWQLFNLYSNIQSGLITKQEARKQILDYGLVKFKPKMTANIGQPKELFKNGQIAIVNLSNTKIKVGDIIIVEKENSFSKTKVISLQVDNKDVNETENGEVGIKVDIKIAKGAILWKE